MISQDAPVIVVGGGPVGLTTAVALATHDVPVVLLESGDGSVRAEWRGSTLHPPTLELLDEIGLTPEILSGSTRVDRVQHRDLEFDEVVEFDFGLLEGHTPYPFRTQFEQYKMLRLLGDRAARAGEVDLRFRHTVREMRQDDDGVTVTADTPDGRVELRAAFLIAADGSHSALRKHAGIGFPGVTLDTRSIVAASPFPFERVVGDLAPVSYWSGPSGRLSLIRTPDVWRLAVSAPGEQGGSTADPHPAVRTGLDLLTGAAGDVELIQHQTYRSHQRVAETFHLGRLLLVGDAAHLNSTTGGMGLNSGVHDAFEAADRLVPVIRSGADADEAAATYGAARRAAAMEFVQPLTHEGAIRLAQRDPAERRQRLAELAGIAADEDRSRAHVMAASMLTAPLPERVRKGLTAR
ncbi:FAD-dependent oxidoreductase [Streptosporangium sp. CA-115845]|uniref:FAD-dependent oxidoreductase n=1 Tax=Streptosporangium sp. CA-115845 TaxID=3240071 RepID=UPI003D8CDA28